MLTCVLLLALTFQAGSPLSVPSGSRNETLLPNGQWEPSFQHEMTGFPPILPRFNAAHMALIPKGPHRGKVMAWDIRADSTNPSWLQRWSIIDPAAPGGPAFLNYLLAMPEGEGDLFCAGLAWTSAGDLLVTGGTSQYPGLIAEPFPRKKPTIAPVGSTPCTGQGCSHGGTPTSLSPPCTDCGVGCGCGCQDGASSYVGGKLTYLWHPDDGVWYQQPDLAIDRWYPTAVLRGNGSLLVAGGITAAGEPVEETNNYEVFLQTGFNPPSGVWQLPQLFPGPTNFVSLFYIYPRLHALTTGEVFLAGMTSHAAKLEHTSAPGVWIKGKNSSFDTRIYETTVLMPYVPDAFGSYTDEVLILGGIGIDYPKARRSTGGPALISRGTQSSVEVSHPTAANQGWSAAPSMAYKRKYANAVLLPDGSLFVVGGNSAGGTSGGVVWYPELYDGTGWTQLPPLDTPRTYHSTAVLLPDGRVLSAGGNTSTRDYQIFVPSYLSNGDPRPVITVAPTTMGYHAENPMVHSIGFEPMPSGHSVERAVLISPGAVTHHTDCNQRYVQLILDTNSVDQIDVLAPANRNLVPPGYYMLFLISAAGVPSEAAWVNVQ